ncbi:MAG: glycine--tRNA ligase subunit beta, partial [Pseudomonadota bacterium]
WGDGALRWVRPLHSILCVFDGAPLAFSVDGVPAGGATRGHRVHGGDAFEPRSFAEYEQELRARRVILQADERRALIQERARALCAEAGLELIEDDALLNEVAGLAEWPVPLLGRMDEKFLSLPAEVLTTAMRMHQKYFSVRDPKTGGLAPRFVVVANLEAEDGGAAIVAGNERVLTARLSDARFLWDQDRKEKLEARVGALRGITFFEGLGTIGDKAQRISELAAVVSEAMGQTREVSALAREAGRLAKADLVTEMVGEFPELQGVMGRYYALADGQPDGVADAIRDHYKPTGQDDAPPSAATSVAVALADKIDTLVGFWIIGKKPTGSKDPFALRRAALGVIQIVVANEIALSLTDLFRGSAFGFAEGQDGALGAGPDDFTPDLLAFFHDRLRVYLRDRGVAHDVIDAAFAVPGQDDIYAMVRRVEAVQAFIATADGVDLLAAYKRADNILKAEEKRDGTVFATDDLHALELTAPAERTLREAVVSLEDAVAARLETGDFTGALKALAGLRPPLDAFFEAVVVNDDAAEVRRARLMLLSAARGACDAVAALSKLEG